MKRFILLFSLSFQVLLSVAQEEAATRPNVLFIFVDDLRPELGCYDHPVIKTPHLDKLASASVLFKQHYVQVPTCGASRFSLLTGMLPRTSAHLRNDAAERFISKKTEGDRPETFIHHLRRNGYYTVGIGKVSHAADGLLYDYTGDPQDAKRELPHSWDELAFDSGKWGTGWNAFFGYADGSNRQSMDRKVRPYERGAVSDEDYPDGLTANLAVEKLKILSKRETPFFMGVGFFKPHLPFNAPEKYWNLYDASALPLTSSPGIPENVNTASLHHSGEFNGYLSGDEKPSLTQPLSEAYARRITHAYYASVSYVDAQIGKVLDALEPLGLAENTIIIVWGDHGWHLGDHRVWGKHTIFEKALKTPLIVKVPGIQRNGYSINDIVSSIDVYPSLMELCGVTMPHQTDGKSFVPMFTNQRSRNINEVAYGYFNNGISMRNKRFRLTRYFREAEPVIELYDHKRDPHEMHNIADRRAATVRKLMPLLENGNTGLFQSLEKTH